MPNIFRQRKTPAITPTSCFLSTKQLSLRKKVLISFSVAVLLGLSWILGYLVLVTSGQSQLVFSIIFCICTTTQVPASLLWEFCDYLM